MFLNLDKEKNLGILSVVKSDVEELLKGGFSNEYISKSVGIDRNMIDYIVSVIKEPERKKSPKINTKELKS